MDPAETEFNPEEELYLFHNQKYGKSAIVSEKKLAEYIEKDIYAMADDQFIPRHVSLDGYFEFKKITESEKNKGFWVFNNDYVHVLHLLREIFGRQTGTSMYLTKYYQTPKETNDHGYGYMNNFIKINKIHNLLFIFSKVIDIEEEEWAIFRHFLSNTNFKKDFTIHP